MLDAGRESLYVREQRRTESSREWLATVEEFVQTAAGTPIVVAEEKTAERLDALRARPAEFSVIDSSGSCAPVLRSGWNRCRVVDANYVLPESEIYTRPKQQRSTADRNG